jgi:uncharacterized protein YdcH (DUF465 family)
MNEYETRIAELDKFQARFEMFQEKIMELQKKINEMESSGDFESFEHDALCYMQAGLQQAMQKEHDNFYSA